jgi:hypothetical protein
MVSLEAGVTEYRLGESVPELGHRVNEGVLL